MKAPGPGRRHTLVIGLLLVLAVVRGGYWAVTLETWSPADEAQHFGYIESLARGHGIPTVGHDRLSDDVMAITKVSPTYFARSRPFVSDSADENWGASREQYEAIHGPVYYALMVPAYWVGHALKGPLGAVYVVRLASVLLAAAALPLAWALGRRLLPDRPMAWLLGPTLLLAVNGFMATAATVSNDMLVVTGAVASLLLATWAASTARWLPALLAGAAAGATFVGKSTALGLFPLIVLICVVQHRSGAATAQRWRTRTLAAAAGALAVTAPWIAWNLITYDAISAAHAAEAITGNLQTTLEPSLDTLHRHWEGARLAFWDGGLLTGEASYRRMWDLIALTLGSLGLVAAISRWRRPEALTVACLGLAFPIAFATMVAFFFVVLGGSGLLLGRYVYVALVPLVLALGASALALVGARWAPPLVLGVTALMLWQEIDLTDHYLTTTYEVPVVDPALAPIVDQSWNDGLVRATAVRIDAGCPVEVIQIGLERPPRALVVHSREGATTAERVGTIKTSFSTYRLDDALAGPLRFEVPEGSGVAVSGLEREGGTSLDGAPEDPLVRAWCRVGRTRAAEIRFDHTYGPQHPPVGRDVLRAWPRVWFVGGLAAWALAMAVALRSGRDRVRRPSAVDDATERR